MKKVVAIGEMLIDFIPVEKGLALKDVDQFIKAPGGAPANVAACVAILGGHSEFIGQVGNDAFGAFLIETLETIGVETNHILKSNEANTALAFVSLKADGERDFSFYRNPSADMLFSKEQLHEDWLGKDILHFCSVSLIDAPIKYTHQKAIRIIKENGGIISFDPNVRLSLWDNSDRCRETILKFVPLADLIKISDEELEFITGIKDVNKAIQSLFVGDVKAVIYTQGAKGATFYSREYIVHSQGQIVEVVDTTGAGDAFIGGFLYSLTQLDKKIEDLTEKEIKEILQFANIVGALTTTKKGGISALPSLLDIKAYLTR